MTRKPHVLVASPLLMLIRPNLIFVDEVHVQMSKSVGQWEGSKIFR